MPTFSFTEKEWDKIRPSSVKKTGVSEAMRDVLKKVPKDLKDLADAKGCDAAETLLGDLDTAFESAEALVKKAKDDKHDAAGKLKSWRAEVKDAVRMVELQKDKLLLGPANQAAEAKIAEVLREVESAIDEAKRLATDVQKDLAANRTVNVTELTKTQQNFRGVQRDARDVTKKAGFIRKVMYLDEIRKVGLDPKRVTYPTTIAKKIDGKLEDLEREIDALGEAIGEAIDKQATVVGDGALAKESRKLLDDYKSSYKKIKALGAAGKKLLATTKKANQTVQATKVADTSKLLTVIYKMHTTSQEFEEAVLKESYRSRDGSGDLQVRLSAMAQKDGFDIAMNQPFRDWRAAIFDAIRLCTLPGGAVKDEIDEAVEYVISLGGASADQAEGLAKRIADERTALGRKYGSTAA